MYAALGATPEARARAERIAAELAAAGTPLRSVAEPLADARAGFEVAPARLEVLNRAERALLEARELSAELREAAALRVLSEAEALLLDALEVPGVHAFLAEVYVQLGLCAAQLDEMGLFETALARALSLDPRRRVEAAEAPPALVARARELGQALDLAAPSELSIRGLPPGNQTWLDGTALDSLSTPVRVRAGSHVLVVRAPGYAAYATLLKLEPGPRPALQVSLSPLPAEEARAALALAPTRAAASGPAQRLAQLRHEAVLLIEPSADASDRARALVYRCQAEGCALWLGRERGAGQPMRFEAPLQAYAWLNAKAVRDQPTPTRAAWKRWVGWAAATVAVVAGASAAIWATRDPPVRERRELELDPGALPH